MGMRMAYLDCGEIQKSFFPRQQLESPFLFSSVSPTTVYESPTICAGTSLRTGVFQRIFFLFLSHAAFLQSFILFLSFKEY
jgi:hypothetical protein